MNEREIKLAQIEQNQADRQRLVDEGRKLQAELAGLDKPKQKHGDYKIDKNGVIQFFVKDDETDLIRLCQSRSLLFGSAKNYYIFEDKDIIQSGNLVDDLKRNSEDLKEFTVFAPCTNTNGFSARLSGDGAYIICRDWYFTLKELTEIHQKLGQLLATAKRKAK